MIKDVLQYKYSNNNYTALRSPRNQSENRNTSVNKSIMSVVGDPKKNADKLKLMLLHIKYPSAFNE